ncbi:MAG: DUF1549 domain-containing protein [Planctomycetaceae bacterium]|nr:DUF1549 domain-containing protein [Planctomycetaceae bacterium]
MRIVVVLFAMMITCLVLAVVQFAGRVEQLTEAPADVAVDPQLDAAVQSLNERLHSIWQAAKVPPAVAADELDVLRRLSLALFGTVPSLEDIRAFENDSGPNRIDRWVVKMLQDSRYSDYFSERLARSLVGIEDGPLIIFRRDRLAAWLAVQLHKDASWSDMTKELIAAEGLWTDQPATNFITVARTDDEGLDENKLAGRTVRTFLGQRIDCAQCHDHPFDPAWHQADFEGLAAFFCQAALTPGGVTDGRGDSKRAVYKVITPGTELERTVPAAVPFHSEWLPADGGLRTRLAEWVTHCENRRFERAIANRVWGFMFGKPWHEPVDDLPHPVAGETDILDILGQEFRARGDRLSVLIRMIAQSDAFRRSSKSNVEHEEGYVNQVKVWSVFPLVRLRPEQVIGSLFQAGHIRTIDQNSNPFVRLQKFGNERDFLNEYGDLGEDELLQQVGTIPQALLRMNGRFTGEQSKVDLLSATSQIISFSPDDTAIVDNCFLACLCRHPSQEEQTFFLNQFESARQPDRRKDKAEFPEDVGNAGAASAAKSTDAEQNQTTDGSESTAPVRRTRAEVVEDLVWALFNSPEFSWNH